MPSEMEIRQTGRKLLYQLLETEKQLHQDNIGKDINLMAVTKLISQQKATMEQEDVKLVEKQIADIFG